VRSSVRAGDLQHGNEVNSRLPVKWRHERRELGKGESGEGQNQKERKDGVSGERKEGGVWKNQGGPARPSLGSALGNSGEPPKIDRKFP